MTAQAPVDALLADLDPEQLEAVRITTGPLVVRAGAGSGKTRVITTRVAHALATGVTDARSVLVVTFTERAASEMAERIAHLGYPGVTARTFHAAALNQLRALWSLGFEGEPPEVLDSKVPLLARRIRPLPPPWRFVPALDVADAIERAKRARLTPRTWRPDGSEPLPPDVFARVWEAYEREKDHAGRLDFDDMLLRLLELFDRSPKAIATVRRRFAWFSVDEYQDTNPLANALLDVWLGDRRDLAVVGDEDQTIYTFNGATDRYLRDFERRFPDARHVTLSRNYRSAPGVLAVANRLLASAGSPKRLVATRPAGPPPVVTAYPTDEAELRGIVTGIREALGVGVAAPEVAVLVRTNAQTAPIEAALAAAGIAHVVRGGGALGRREAKAAFAVLRRLDPAVRGDALIGAFEDALRRELGYAPDQTATGREAREVAGTLQVVLRLARAAATPSSGAADVAHELERRAAAARDAAADGVVLTTYHRAKGLEWDMVLLPSLEEGSLPVRGSADDPDTLAEERRLLYVGITRARDRLVLSWARSRPGTNGTPQSRRPSRFLADLAPPGAGGVRRSIGEPRRAEPQDPVASLDPPALARFERLRAWRLSVAQEARLPPYVVAHDSLLRILAEAVPTTLDELADLPGIGPTKLERYGEGILGALADEPALDPPNEAVTS